MVASSSGSGVDVSVSVSVLVVSEEAPPDSVMKTTLGTASLDRSGELCTSTAKSQRQCFCRRSVSRGMMDVSQAEAKSAGSEARRA